MFAEQIHHISRQNKIQNIHVCFLFINIFHYILFRFFLWLTILLNPPLSTLLEKKDKTNLLPNKAAADSAVRLFDSCCNGPLSSVKYYLYYIPYYRGNPPNNWTIKICGCIFCLSIFLRSASSANGVHFAQISHISSWNMVVLYVWMYPTDITYMYVCM